MDLRQIWGLIGKSVSAWIDDFAPGMGAAVAYYTLFSIAPLSLLRGSFSTAHKGYVSGFAAGISFRVNA